MSSMLMLAGTGVVNHAPPKASLTKPTSWLTGEQVYLKSLSSLPEAADGARDKVWRGLQHIAPCSLFRQPMSIRRAKGSHILH